MAGKELVQIGKCMVVTEGLHVSAAVVCDNEGVVVRLKHCGGGRADWGTGLLMNAIAIEVCWGEIGNCVP
jgi:hypothetical protein